MGLTTGDFPPADPATFMQTLATTVGIARALTRYRHGPGTLKVDFAVQLAGAE
jgi:hypothetical protein